MILKHKLAIKEYFYFAGQLWFKINIIFVYRKPSKCYSSCNVISNSHLFFHDGALSLRILFGRNEQASDMGEKCLMLTRCFALYDAFMATEQTIRKQSLPFVFTIM